MNGGDYSTFIIPNMEKDLECVEKYMKFRNTEIIANRYDEYLSGSNINPGKGMLFFLSRNNFYVDSNMFENFNIETNLMPYIDIKNYMYLRKKKKQKMSMRKYMGISWKAKIKRELEDTYSRYFDAMETLYRNSNHYYNHFFCNDVLCYFFDIRKEENKRYAYDNNGLLFTLLSKNSQKSPFKNTYKNAFFDEKECIARLDLKSYNGSFVSFDCLSRYFCDIFERKEEIVSLKPEIIETECDEIEFEYVIEQILGIRTAVYLVTKLFQMEKNRNAKFRDEELYDIFCVLIYVFMYPNIFARKNLADELLLRVDNWEINPLFDFHKNISQEEYDEFIEYGALTSNRELYMKQIEQSVLSLIFTSLPIVQALSYGTIKGNEIKYQKKLEEKIETYKDSNIIRKAYNSDNNDKTDNSKCENDSGSKEDSSNHEDNNGNSEDENKKTYTERCFDLDYVLLIESIKEKREKDLFCKLYRFLKMKLYNKEILDRWSRSMDLNLERNDIFKPLIQSLLEYERINAFNGIINEKYYSKEKLNEQEYNIMGKILEILSK